LLSGRAGDREVVKNSGRGIRVDSVYVGSVRHFEAMNEAIGRWALRPVVDRVFPFAEAKAAYAYLQAAKHVGKVVIDVSGK
jgi:NADPH:quinone reductase-like Zn-dependent oxidoreductase